MNKIKKYKQYLKKNNFFIAINNTKVENLIKLNATNIYLFNNSYCYYFFG